MCIHVNEIIASATNGYSINFESMWKSSSKDLSVCAFHPQRNPNLSRSLHFNQSRRSKYKFGDKPIIWQRSYFGKQTPEIVLRSLYDKIIQTLMKCWTRRSCTTFCKIILDWTKSSARIRMNVFPFKNFQNGWSGFQLNILQASLLNRRAYCCLTFVKRWSNECNLRFDEP